MKKKRIAAIALLVLVCVLLAGCGNDAAKPAATEASVQPQGEPFAEGITDKEAYVSSPFSPRVICLHSLPSVFF